MPVYPTLSAPQIWFILAESGARIAIVANAAQVAKINEAVPDAYELETIVVMDGDAKGGRFRVLTLADVIARGRAIARPPTRRRPTATAQTAAARPARRAGHDRLHVGHDGRPRRASC